MQETSDIQEFFNGAHVLITGATGFLGKVLLEKILRSCPGVSKIYLLIRTKKGKDEKTRLHEIINDVLFRRLHTESPDFMKKLQIIPGDCALTGLGLSSDDRDVLLKNVDIVFHGAATVRFDENLKLAAKINVGGTIEVIKICRQIKDLKAFVHISTAYSNCNRDKIEEKIYPAPACTDRLLEVSSVLTAEEIDKLTPQFLQNWPNTYTLTKAVAESIIKREEGHMPICILRPAIVVSTLDEPLQGWTDNIYGPMGFLVGSSVGVIRVITADEAAKANMIPVDIVVNGLITAAYQTYRSFRNGETNINIYNFGSVNLNPISWGTYMKYGKEYGAMMPPIQAVWCFELFLIKHRLMVLLLSIFLHFIPAVFLDAASILSGRKPKLIRLSIKANKYSEALRYFSVKTIEMTDKNYQRLIEASSAIDRKLFNMDVRTFEWGEYLYHHVRGAREFILKEPWDNIPQASAKFRRFRIIQWVLKMVLVLTFGYYFLGFLYQTILRNTSCESYLV